MSDLTDALADKVVLETEAIIYDTAPSLVQPYLDVVAAARRVAEAPEWLQRLLENPPPEPDEKTWCEVHDFEWTAPQWFYRCSVGDKRAEDCRMVRKLLVDPDNL